jgi:murein DD-endopeptidase MepM/ murein hydrolase activator NlpD
MGFAEAPMKHSPRPRASLGVAAIALVLPWISPAQGGVGGAIGGHGHGDCITPAERAAAQSAVEAFLAANPQPEGPGVAPAFPIWPQGGNLFGDLYAGSFVDLDPTPGIIAFTCGPHTRDTHGGTDADIKFFGEQAIGVPVVAAQDGTVAATHDGEPDMNTQLLGQISNYVIVAHAGGRQSWYWHLKNGSVAVSAGQVVKAGQQIGLTASSGNSGGPHLHWEVQDSGVVKEPWAGPCRPGPSLFVNQPAYDGGMWVRDFAFMRQPPQQNGSDSYPFTPTRTSHFAATDPLVYFWILVQNPPAGSMYKVRWKRPNGTVSYESGPWPLNNPAWSYAWWWFTWNVWEMATIHGTWRLEFELNGAIAANVPFDVLPTFDPAYNRPPEPITVSMDPPAPGAGAAIACRVGGSLFLDDLDWDIVRYQYVWKVNGQTVRSVTSAGRADFIPHHLASVGQTVTCDVTPSDGLLTGATVTGTAAIQGLAQDHPTVSLSQGGVVTLAIDLGAAYAGATYVTGGSLSGTSPGIVAAPGVVVPLVYDSWTSNMLTYPNSPPYSAMLGALDPQGAGKTIITVPAGLPPGYAGAAIWHASIALGTPWLATNAVMLTAVP